MSDAVAAIDLGATSGRVIVGRVGPNELTMETVGRFANEPVRTDDGLHWNVDALFRGVLDGLREAARVAPDLLSIGVDSWAVDYALMRDGQMLNTPFHYRDERTAAGVAAVHEQVSQAGLYRRNGLQFLPFNTVYQLAVERDRGRLAAADAVLLIPDLIAFWLTGEMRTEVTNASTTGLLKASSSTWDTELMSSLGLPATLWPELVQPGERVGQLTPAVTADLGLSAPVPVLAVGSHDTASAVVAVPLTSRNSAYISCGTWGLVGLELDRPVRSDAAREANFTNELGVDGRTRFLHNVMGLWLLSESVRKWTSEGTSIDLPALLNEAAAIRESVAVFDANDPSFLSPGNMPARIAEWCVEHDQPVPQSPAEFARSIIESLAHAFTDAVRSAESLSGVSVDVIHLVGGGALNQLLCQRLADVSGLDVLAGPVEATALGNVLIQARANGMIAGDLEAMRALVRQTHPPIRFTPSTQPGGSSW